jgi:hypothetical protein
VARPRSLIFVIAVVTLWAGGIVSAQDAENSPYPKMLKGEDLFIPGKPIVGYLTAQERYTTLENEPGAPSDYFSLRRLKLRILGEPLSGLQYYVQGIYKTNNYSSTDNQVFLQEARVKWDLFPSTYVQVGQFIPPMGLERFIPDEMLYTIDRSQVTDHLVPNGNIGDSFTRDYGVQLGGKFPASRLAYAMALMGGNGANNDHLGERGSYLLDGQMTWQPYRHETDGFNLILGGAASFRRNQDLDLSKQLPGSSRLGYGHFDGADEHFNLFFDLSRGPFSFLGEGFYAWYDSYRAGLPSLSAQGFYVLAAYFLSPRWQVVGRYETFDPHVHLQDSEDMRWITLGLNWYLLGNQLKFMANYILKSQGKEGFADHTLMAQVQFFFGYPRNPRLEEGHDQ